MKLEQFIIPKLKSLNKKFIKSGSNFLLCQCLNPKHKDNKPSFSINLESGKGFCFACGFKIDKSFWVSKNNFDLEEIERQEFLNSLKNKLEKKEVNDKVKKEIILPPKSGNVRNKYRGISKRLYNELGVYVTKVGKFKGSIIFPITQNRHILGFESNFLNKEKSKYKHSFGFEAKEFIFGYDYLKKLNKNYIVFTEGIYDAISMLQAGIPATPNWGVADNFSFKKIKSLIELGIEIIYISLDKDEKGRLGEKNILKNELLKENFKVKSGRMLRDLKDYYKSPFKDFNDYLRNQNGK